MRISDLISDACSSDLVNPVQHHIFIAHIEGGDGFRSIRIDDEERRQLTLVGKAHYRELSVVRHFGGLDGGRSLHDVVGVARAFQDRKSVVWGESVSVCVDLGGRGIIKKKI